MPKKKFEEIQEEKYRMQISGLQNPEHEKRRQESEDAARGFFEIIKDEFKNLPVGDRMDVLTAITGKHWDEISERARQLFRNLKFRVATLVSKR